ncbi:MAG: tetratricopeptide repeat protein [Gemmatimonadota bacterium]|nr:tetratricopeptide repeat protein [Gemmatimonadota bacterium]
MSKVNQLKNKARREEQRENWSKAIELYTQALDASRKEGEAFADLSLYNRIGDIYLRIGQKNTAVRYYEQAIERYAEQDLHTSAIALCNKVLRIHPERSTVFLQLGRLHLATNLIADARAHYHKYAEAMRERGSDDTAFEALEELIDDTGDAQTLTLWVTWLAAMSDQDEALERVEEVRSSLISHGVEPDSIIDQIRTGEVAGVEGGPQMDAAPDPLAGAFLSTPDPFDSSRAQRPTVEEVIEEVVEDPAEPVAAELVGPDEETDRTIQPIDALAGLDSLFGDTPADDEQVAVDRTDATGAPEDVSRETRSAEDDADVEPAVSVEHVSAADEAEVPEPLELGSVQWDDEAEEVLAELNQPLVESWGEYSAEVHDAVAAPMEESRHAAEDEDEEAPTADILAANDIELEDLEPADGLNSTTPQAWRSDTEATETTDGPPPTVPDETVTQGTEGAETDTGSTVDAAFGVPEATGAWEAAESDALDPGIRTAPELSFESGELDGAVEWSDTDGAFAVEPSITEDEVPEPEVAEPPEMDLETESADFEPLTIGAEDGPEVGAEPPAPHAFVDFDSSSIARMEDEESIDLAADPWEDDAAAAVEAAGQAPEDVETAAVATDPIDGLDMEVVAVPDEQPAFAVEPGEILAAEADEVEAETVVEEAEFGSEIELVPVTDLHPTLEVTEIDEPAVEVVPIPDAQPVLEIDLDDIDAAVSDGQAPIVAAEPAEEALVEIGAIPDTQPLLNVQPDEVADLDSEVDTADEDRAAASNDDLEILVEPTPAPDPAGEVEITVSGDDSLATAVDPFVPPGPSEMSAKGDAEGEAMTVEVPDARELVPAGAPASAELAPAASMSDGADPTPEALDDVSAPLAEPRLTVGEDPEDAFRDWVQSASMGVLTRALPELEHRSEVDKAILVIQRLAQLEDHGVEFKTRLVDTLEKLGRTPQAADAGLALANALESLDRRPEARSAYLRVLRIKPGHEDARTALDALGEVAEPEVVEEGVEVRTTPYMPDHVGSNDASMLLDDPQRKPSGVNGHSNSNGNTNGDLAPEPYSGVAGGAEASDDFEKLLTEFRAELHHRPGEGGAASRTELGASLKEMGRLDDAIRELQAAVNEPSPSPIAFELLGEAFLEKGQGRIAVRLLEKAIGTLGQGDRELMGILYQLGHAYEVTDDRTKALMCYERIFSVDIDYRDIQERIMACSS